MSAEGGPLPAWWTTDFGDELATSLSKFSDIDQPTFRREMLKNLGERLGYDGAFPAAHSDDWRDHVRYIVSACRSHRSQSVAVRTLIAVMKFMRPDEGAMDRLEKCADWIYDGAAPAVAADPPGAIASANRDGVDEIELSADVQDAYGHLLRTAPEPCDLPAKWSLAELSRLLSEVQTRAVGPSKLEDALKALCDALRAKKVFLSLGGPRLKLYQLQCLYRREIDAWPEGDSADALLAEAASVTIGERRERRERRERVKTSLSALARYLVGVAAALGSLPADDLSMVSWVGTLGDQMADVTSHFGLRRGDPAWLLIDLGKEPHHGSGRGERRREVAAWPRTLTWTLVRRNGAPECKWMECKATATGLRHALREVMRSVPPARPLLVDLAVPRWLMEQGIEHWPVCEVDGQFLPLSAECRPRLRWSERRHDLTLYNKLLDRIERGYWNGEPGQWLNNDPHHACFLGGYDQQHREDLLRILLREGCGFILWFSAGLPGTAIEEIARAVCQVPAQSRRAVLPDYLPEFADRPAIIWDDPRGRDEFSLPPLVPLEYI